MYVLVESGALWQRGEERGSGAVRSLADLAALAGCDVLSDFVFHVWPEITLQKTFLRPSYSLLT
jgi:hypothetical protein